MDDRIAPLRCRLLARKLGTNLGQFSPYFDAGNHANIAASESDELKSYQPSHARGIGRARGSAENRRE